MNDAFDLANRVRQQRAVKAFEPRRIDSPLDNLYNTRNQGFRRVG